MKPVSKILEEVPEQATMFITQENNLLSIYSSPEGLRTLSEILLAQADALGNKTQGCSSVFEQETSGGLLQPLKESQSLGIHIHCHEGYPARD